MEQMMMKDLREMEKELDKELPERDVEKEKQLLINQLKGLKKEDIIPKPEKYTLWQRIKRTIGF
jgi:hypothetical protein